MNQVSKPRFLMAVFTAAYKRGTLIFHDVERLAKIQNSLGLSKLSVAARRTHATGTGKV